MSFIGLAGLRKNGLSPYRRVKDRGNRNFTEATVCYAFCVPTAAIYTHFAFPADTSHTLQKRRFVVYLIFGADAC